MSQDELIELQALTPEGYIELVAPRPVAGRQDYSERVRLVDGGVCWEGPGEGHAFEPCSLVQPTWCDLCGEFVWGLYRQSLRCTREYLPGCVFPFPSPSSLTFSCASFRLSFPSCLPVSHAASLSVCFDVSLCPQMYSIR